MPRLLGHSCDATLSRTVSRVQAARPLSTTTVFTRKRLCAACPRSISTQHTLPTTAIYEQLQPDNTPPGAPTAGPDRCALIAQPDP